MIGNYFRPWGDLNWLLPKLPKIKWDLLGCLSTEDRFDAALQMLQTSGQLNSALFYKIFDPPSQDTESILEKLSVNENKLQQRNLATIQIEDHGLLEVNSSIVKSVLKFSEQCSGNIIVDISTFPKRFFFPILKLLMGLELSNLVVAYSTPASYCKDELSGNPYSWNHLPLFMPVDFPEPAIEVAIVGVGFMPFSLPDLLLSKYNATSVKFLFPFPPGPPNYQRTWDFMRKIEKSFNFKPSDSIIRLDSNNMPDAYEYIVREADSGTKKVLFAPYGPKPISLAMCIYATLNDCPVYYTQPTYYNPEYSAGVKHSYGYCIIMNRKNLYAA